MQSFNDDEAFGKALATLKEGGIGELDTAARYPPPSYGESEKRIGRAKAGTKGFVIDTKVLMATGDGSGELGSQAIDRSIQESLERLQIKQVGRWCSGICLQRSMVTTETDRTTRSTRSTATALIPRLHWPRRQRPWISTIGKASSKR